MCLLFINEQQNGHMMECKPSTINNRRVNIGMIYQAEYFNIDIEYKRMVDMLLFILLS